MKSGGMRIGEAKRWRRHGFQSPRQHENQVKAQWNRQNMKWNPRKPKICRLQRGSRPGGEAAMAGRSLFKSFSDSRDETLNARRGWEDVWSESNSWWAASSDRCLWLLQALEPALFSTNPCTGSAFRVLMTQPELLSCRMWMWSRNRKPPPVCWAVCWGTDHVVLMDAEEPGCSLPSSVLHC